MDNLSIDGLSLKRLKKIPHPKGEILHALKKGEDSFLKFGEAYFTNINPGEIKGWKKHNKLISNLIVPIGEVTFVIYDDRKFSKSYNKFNQICLSYKNYKRLTVDEGLWLGFKGTGNKQNLILNIASLEHDQNESVDQELSCIPFDWSSV